MDLDKPRARLSQGEQDVADAHLREAMPYGDPRKVWVEDGHVYVETHDGTVVVMTPEVAIRMGRLLSEAGSSSLINRVMDNGC